MEVVREREVIREIPYDVERIEWIDVPTPNPVTREVVVEVPIKGTVVKRIEEPFDVVREVIVQKV